MGTDGAEGDPSLLQLLSPPLEDEGPPLVGFLGATDPTIESSDPIRLEEVDGLMMTAIGVSMQDHGDGEALDAFHAGNPPSTDGPLIGVVSHPPIPPLEVDHHVPLFMLFIFI